VIVESLTLKNFRSFKKTSFSFLPRTTLILGPNTSGKTNILEAIYLLATGKSFRADIEREMIEYQCQMSNVKCEMDNGDTLEIILTVGEVAGQPAPTKKYLVNGVPRRMIDFVGNLRAVLFWPEDLDLVTNSPSRRRQYLDFILSQVDREYRRSLLIYEKAIRQRNKLLERIRDENLSRVQLTYWDELLIKHGGVLTDKRREYIDEINKYQISNIKYQIEYDKSIISETRLEQYKNEEIAAAVTLVGPHRDDIKFEIRNPKPETTRNLSIYGSRGEQRLTVLWLKLAELEFIKAKTGDKPLLLLDDIFSELDHQHRDLVLQVIPHQQTIMTTTDLHLIEEKYLKSVKVIKLE